MPDSLLKQYQQRSTIRTALDTYWSVCQTLQRRDDLAQLIQWATRKRLSKPRSLYQHLLVQEEQRLWRYERRAPQVTTLAKLLVGLNALLNPVPKSRYRPGYAASYGR